MRYATAEHIAEKMHAYTRKYGASGYESTRPKDLVDILLIAGAEPLDAAPPSGRPSSSRSDNAGSSRCLSSRRRPRTGKSPTDA